MTLSEKTEAEITEAAPKFTPGPWKVHPYRDARIGPHNAAIDVGPSGLMVARICGEFDKPIAGPEAEANAHLVSAAPDLFAALEHCLEALNGESRSDELDYSAIATAIHALRKARGDA